MTPGKTIPPKFRLLARCCGGFLAARADETAAILAARTSMMKEAAVWRDLQLWCSALEQKEKMWLQEDYRNIFKEDPPAAMKKKDLIDAIFVAYVKASKDVVARPIRRDFR